MILRNCLLGFLAFLSGCATNHQSLLPDSQFDKESFAIGYQTGGLLRSQGGIDNLNMEVYFEALKKGFYQETDLPLDMAEIEQLIISYQTKQQGFTEADRRKLAQLNAEAGADYRRANMKKDGVITIHEGLQYRPIKSSASGRSPALQDTIIVHYHGRRIDGSTFDSSIERGHPLKLNLSSVIKGWQEILPLMKEGDKWEVVMSPELAYGEAGSGGGTIEPNATLVFEIELLEVQGES